MQIWLIRHGETGANLDSSLPPVLTEKGKSQVASLKRLTGFDAIYSSDLERCLETAKVLGPRFIRTADLREIYRAIVGGPPKESRPHRLEEDTARADRFFTTMLSWQYRKVAVVCHGNIIRYFLARAQGIDPQKMWTVAIEPASISVLEVEETVRVTGVNDVSHLVEPSGDVSFVD